MIMNQNKCPMCGAFFHKDSFYTLKRFAGTYSVWICPNCGHSIKQWIPNKNVNI